MLNSCLTPEVVLQYFIPGDSGHHIEANKVVNFVEMYSYIYVVMIQRYTIILLSLSSSLYD